MPDCSAPLADALARQESKVVQRPDCSDSPVVPLSRQGLAVAWTPDGPALMAVLLSQQGQEVVQLLGCWELMTDPSSRQDSKEVRFVR